MTEHPFDPASVEQPYRARFEQLVAEFPDCEVWQLHENFGRWLSASLVDRATGVSLSIPVYGQGADRTWAYHDSEIESFRRRLRELATGPAAS